MRMFTNIKLRRFYILSFFTVIFFILPLPVISSAQWKDQSVFQMPSKGGIAEAREKKVEQDDKGKESSDEECD